MDSEQIISELRGFIRERFSIPEHDPDFNDDTDLFNYGYIDSFGTVELANFVEGRFSIKFSGADWITFPLASVREISNFIAKRRKSEN